MFPFLRPGRAPEDTAQQVLDRAVGLLKRYERAGAAVLPVADVLEMLGAGTGTTATGNARREEAREPGADPITGCKPVTPGGSYPGSS